jgi:hypothetical protein
MTLSNWLKSIFVVAGILLLASSLVGAGGGESAPVVTTPHFEFFSDFETNLNDALIVAGTKRKDDREELFSGEPETADCFSKLAPSARLGWDLAVDFYAEIVSPTSWMGRQQYSIRAELASFDEQPDTRVQSFLKTAEGLRLAAAAAYKTCGWPAQDADNRRWIEEVMPSLAAHEATITDRLVEVYGAQWRGLPIRVDMVAAALPVGASTFHTPPHIMISSSVEDRDALEIVHHEASHTLMGRKDPVQVALSNAASALDVEVPRDLWHVVLFYTTGEVVSRTLEEAGQPGYVPYMYVHDLWDGRWGPYQHAVETTWPGYLDGSRTLGQSATDLLRAISLSSGDGG